MITDVATRVFKGYRFADNIEVTVNGEDLDPRFDLEMFSPDGFEWSSTSKGASQLALAILAELFVDDDEKALSLYEDFKQRVIVNLPRSNWVLTETQLQAVINEISV